MGAGVIRTRSYNAESSTLGAPFKFMNYIGFLGQYSGRYVELCECWIYARIFANEFV